MPSKELFSREWCDLIFEGRNKDYGAYRIRQRAGKRYRRALVCVLLLAGVFVGATVGGKILMAYILRQEMAKAEEALKKMKSKDLRDGYVVKFQATARLRSASKEKPGGESVVPTIGDAKSEMKEPGYTGPLAFEPDFSVELEPLIDTIAQRNEALPEVMQRVVPTETVKDMPVFPGGPKALMKWLDSHIIYPKKCVDAGVEGQLELSFIVDAQGFVKDPRITSSFNGDIDRVVVLAARRMPKWQPGRDENGVPTEVMITVPVMFKAK